MYKRQPLDLLKLGLGLGMGLGATNSAAFQPPTPDPLTSAARRRSNSISSDEGSVGIVGEELGPEGRMDPEHLKLSLIHI